jgi:hypothetical protein
MEKLPRGLQTFKIIREDGYLYADKTRYIYDLIQEGSYYFLSRPRRFGKSLLVDTMRELFMGNRELFEGLWIAGDESSYEFLEYPVIRLDMTQISISSTEGMKNDLLQFMEHIAQNAGLEPLKGSISRQFAMLIESLADKYSRKVVVLIDEYDKPIVEHIGNPELAQANREVLSSFYGVLKGQGANLRFVFLTGVSKFTNLSLFSKLNNLTDLTLKKNYAGICGFTELEFDELFSDRLQKLEAEEGIARAEIFEWYDGYTWDGKTHVFNPFSLLSFFSDEEFFAYWYRSGTPTFLAQALKRQPMNYSDIQSMTITELLLDSYDIEDAPLVSLLFQTGFLTVKNVIKGSPNEYELGFPNVEVSQSIASLFLSAMTEVNDAYTQPYVKTMRKGLNEQDTTAIAESLAGLYASIPYELHLGKEAFYHAIFLASTQIPGFRVTPEASVSGGRADMFIDLPTNISYVVEFKYVADKTGLNSALESAAAQIKERNYAARYKGTEREVIKLAVAVAGRGDVQVRVV